MKLVTFRTAVYKISKYGANCYRKSYPHVNVFEEGGMLVFNSGHGEEGEPFIPTVDDILADDWHWEA